MQVKSPPSDYHAPKIAILDTGLDQDHPAIMACVENFRQLRSFTDGETRDFHGHGTFIASLILKVAPQSHLYIAKVAERRLLPLNNCIAGVRISIVNFTSRILTSLHQAIRWAIDQEVDIITMSFGMTSADAGIGRAIHEAHSKNIIIFAAASNGGGNQDVTYPARNKEVIPIFSTDGVGNGSTFNPNPIKNDSFSILGEAIRSSWTTYNSSDTTALTKLKSGTSYAAPIAAGMAALILDFVKLRGESCYSELHSQQGMIKAFDIMESKRDGYNYLCPWKKVFQAGAASDSILSKICKEVMN
jgi:subtilisin family serine protease